MKIRAVIATDDNGDLIFACDGCEHMIRVEKRLSESPFWDVHAGLATLQIVGHSIERHS